MRRLDLFVTVIACGLIAPAASMACTVSATPLIFESFGLLTRDIDSTATITVNCPEGAEYTIGLQGSHGSGSNMKLIDGGNEIVYGLYRDSGRSNAWDSIDMEGGAGDGSDRSHTVYGRIFRNERSPAAGSYSDQVTITVTY